MHVILLSSSAHDAAVPKFDIVFTEKPREMKELDQYLKQVV